MKFRGVLFGFLLGFAGTQGRAQSSAEETARAFFKAENESRWRDAALLLDLKTFEWILNRSLSNRPQALSASTVEDLMRLDPKMPRVVAEYQVQRMNQLSRGYDPLSREYAHVPSRDSLAKLSVQEAAARWLQARSPEWQEELAFTEATRRGDRLCDQPVDSMRKVLRAEFRRPAARILGTTMRDSAAYVVVTEGYQRQSALATRGIEPSPSVLQLTMVNGDWRVVPAFDMPDATGSGGSTSFGIGCAEIRVDKNPDN